MSEERADPKALLRAAAGGADAGPHVGSKRLVAYRSGALPAAEREAVQEHLSLCPRCTGLLRELRDFEAAAASPAGPDPLRDEAWQSLVRRLPPRAPASQPVAVPGTPNAPERPRARSWSVRTWPAYAAAAALLLAVGGLTAWQTVSMGRFESRLAEREEALATVRRSEQEVRRQLDAARARVRDLEARADQAGQSSGREAELEARIAALTSEVEALRRTAPDDRIATADIADIEVALSPRFVLRGEESPAGDLLRAGDAANRVPLELSRVAVALDLEGFSDSPEVRFTLLDRAGRVLWSARRPGDSLAGDDGTQVAIQGLAPGRYRLRVEGAAQRTEYVLDVQPQSP